MRKIYTIKFSTNPADMGYDGRPTNWEREKSNARGSALFCMRAFLAWHDKIGKSTYVTFRAYHKGTEIDRGDFLEQAQAQEIEQYC